MKCNCGSEYVSTGYRTVTIHKKRDVYRTLKVKLHFFECLKCGDVKVEVVKFERNRPHREGD